MILPALCDLMCIFVREIPQFAKCSESCDNCEFIPMDYNTSMAIHSFSVNKLEISFTMIIVHSFKYDTLIFLS